MLTPTLPSPQCRKSSSFATLGGQGPDFHDERGKGAFELSRHMRQGRESAVSPLLNSSITGAVSSCKAAVVGVGRPATPAGGRAAAQGRGRNAAARRAPRTGPPCAGQCPRRQQAQCATSRRTLIERNSARATPRRFPCRQVNITCYVNPKGEQYAGERATCDNTSIIAKGGYAVHGDPRRANWPPPMAEAGGRYAAGEGTPPCWAAAPLGRQPMARAGRGQAGRRVGSWARRNRPCCPVRRRRIPRRITACRQGNLHVGARIRRSLPCRVARRKGGNIEVIGGTSGSERRYKERHRGPTNRAAAAAGRRGRRPRRWGARPAVLTAHPRAQGWTAGRAVPLPGRLRKPAWPAPFAQVWPATAS